MAKNVSLQEKKINKYAYDKSNMWPNKLYENPVFGRGGNST